MSRIVVFAGLAGHGKDTAAAVLMENGFQRAPLAGPLKDMIRTVLRARDYRPDIIERLVDGDLKETPHEAFGGNTCRVAMQKLGTEWGRALFGEKFWLDTWSIQHCQPANYVVADCRFANEAGYLNRLGAEIYLVRRPGFVGGAGQHASEDLAWAKGLEVLWNDFATAEEFQDSIRARFF